MSEDEDEMETLRCFWFKFRNPPTHSPLGLGCGITAYDHSDALSIFEEKVQSIYPQLQITEAIEDVDIRSLDAGHVLPNMGLVTNRGIWFPLAF
ncbi:hypothetical protein FCE95_04510 [Luteimonas gilva]|uniref:Uncharacterized protein n=1 Tax=Luteimonas gilva TaxID=2572684 RepID=A0A4U5JUL1_9GAMM|nr:hypothetical protein [Luteimonas gilva]TKR33562.1 hypothetical protein FCE95_04510 [Luteimonas gilva]